LIVWLALFTEKLCATCGAALYVAFPAWSALIVHVPTARTVTLVPETLQVPGVAVVKATARLELAEAEIAKGASPKFLFASALKVIVWLAFDTVKGCETVGAAWRRCPAGSHPRCRSRRR